MPNAHYLSFIKIAQLAAENTGLPWEISLKDGEAADGEGWNITEMAGATPPPVFRLRSFRSDDKTLAAINRRRVENGKSATAAFVFSSDWQSLIKAAVIDRILIRRNQPGSVYSATIRPLAVLATCCNDTSPWNLAPTDLAFAATIADEIQPSRKLGDDVAGIATWLFDKNHLSARCPLSLTGRLAERSKEKRRKRNTEFVRKSLSERKAGAKLPAENAFWEVMRIVHQEQPISFLDYIRFAIVKVLILTGLRSGEAVTIPADWAQWHDYVDRTGKPAGASGGVSRSLSLRHFGEKQRVTGGDSVALYRTSQHVPKMFEAALVELLDSVNRIVQPLRTRLTAQIESGRIFPEFAPGELVPVFEIYTRITGEPFVFVDPMRDELIRHYKINYDPGVFLRIRERQRQLATGGGTLDNKVRVYFAGKLGASINKRAAFRNSAGSLVDGIPYENGYLRVGEFEEFLKLAVPTKLSDIDGLRLSDGTDILPHQLLFLAPKRALSEERNGGICDVTKYAFVGRITPGDFMGSLSGSMGTQTSFFDKYSAAGSEGLALTAHMFRHLQNTELFRLGVADTIITKRFNRTSLAQSHDYDHRSLAEDLSSIEIPDAAQPFLNDRTLAVYKLIASGKASGPIVDEFKDIQQAEGDEAAFVFLATEADGFHTTPYGHCLNSFTVEPCPKALECFAGCRHLTASGLPEHRRNLERLRDRYVTLIQSIDQHPAPPSGKSNILAHAKTRLSGIEAALRAQPGAAIFPNGVDLQQTIEHPFRGPFNEEL